MSKKLRELRVTYAKPPPPNDHSLPPPDDVDALDVPTEQLIVVALALPGNSDGACVLPFDMETRHGTPPKL